jgi:acetyl esterase/lipase
MTHHRDELASGDLLTPERTPREGALVHVPARVWAGAAPALEDAERLAAAGWTVLDAGRAVAAAGDADAAVQVVADACRALHELHGSRPALVAAGEGAGLALAALTERAAPIAAVVLSGGLYDVLHTAQGAAPGTGAEIAARLRALAGTQFLGRVADPIVSPLRSRALGILPPTLLLCADGDPALVQTLALLDELHAANVPVTAAVGRGPHHDRTLAWLKATLDAPPARIGDADHPVARVLALALDEPI